MSITRRLEKLDLNVTNRCNYRCIHCCFGTCSIIGGKLMSLGL